MARIRVSRGCFVTGKLSLEAQANTDSEVYNFGLDLCENFMLKPLGGAWKRSGTDYIKNLNFLDADAIGDFSVRFFEYYCGAEKILCYLVVSKNDADNDGIITFSFMTEKGEHGYYQIRGWLEGGSAENDYGTKFYKNGSLKKVLFWSSENTLYLYIPELRYDNGYPPSDELNRPNIFKFFFDLESRTALPIKGYGTQWESEPLFPLEEYSLEASVYYLGYEKINNIQNSWGLQPLKWSGRIDGLTITAKLLNKDGTVVQDMDILRRFLYKNIFFKYIKENNYSEDRKEEFEDRFANGPYWIGARIVSIHKDYPRKEGDVNLDVNPLVFELKLKEEYQKALFPIIYGIDSFDKAVGEEIEGLGAIPEWCFKTGDKVRFKRVNIDQIYVTAFDAWRNFYENNSYVEWDSGNAHEPQIFNPYPPDPGPPQNLKVIPGWIGSFPDEATSYKGRTYLFYNNYIFASALGTSSINFKIGNGAEDGFVCSWGDGKVGDVKWAISASKIIIGTNSGIYFSDSVIQVSSGTVSYQPPEMLTDVEPSECYPILIGQSILFSGKEGKSVYEISVGENGLQTSRINSHCEGMFREKIIRFVRLEQDFVGAIGEYGEFNVCCFSTTGFTRRWFTYKFGGGGIIKDAFQFNNMKTLGFFNRRIKSLGNKLFCSMEQIINSFDAYRIRSAQQYFLDCGNSEYRFKEIGYIYNGKAPVYEALGDWRGFSNCLDAYKNDLLKVLYYRYDIGDFNSGKLDGGSGSFHYAYYSRNNVLEEGLLLNLYYFFDQDGFENMSVRGVPLLNVENFNYWPFFSFRINKFEFYNENGISYLIIEHNVKFAYLSDKYFMLFPAELGSDLFILQNGILEKNLSIFEVLSANGRALNYSFLSKGDFVGLEIYLSAYKEDLFDEKYFVLAEAGEAARIKILDINLIEDDEFSFLIEKAVGAIGYNGNYYIGIAKDISKDPNVIDVQVELYFKKKYEYKDNFYYDPILFGGEIPILALCEYNGYYETSPILGRAYFIINRFKKDNIYHLIGEVVRYSYDGNSGWFEVDGEKVYEFLLTDDMFNNDGYLYVPKECEGTFLVIGFPYLSELCPVSLEGGNLFGSSEGSIGTSREAALSVFYSRGGKYGNNPGDLESSLYPLRYGLGKSEEGELYTESFVIPLLSDKNNRVRSIYIRHDQACNFAVLNIVQDVKVSDG